MTSIEEIYKTLLEENGHIVASILTINPISVDRIFLEGADLYWDHYGLTPTNNPYIAEIAIWPNGTVLVINHAARVKA